ncbi:TIGR03016 family PEP-CTERM system-associated outer membrane protein [Zoogloea sp.]|uniref:TIGR03016 family PEP-CTERM system-associated outer membrane protein n=1 Tax=Zoogloea sp. TaxID=49181 RepID=UPI0025CF7E20|nr:TIGR03016 family PEP-CTERM system-associated outer membrane protein [Zoogloea sp.]MCK6394169.1 TIGR03016 family PEP-CTERM system-associated outer membrane protein [Zoogloea sp.]
MKLRRHLRHHGSLPSLCFAALSAAFATPAFAEAQAPIFQTAVNVSETITDNVQLRNGPDAKGDWITMISPNVTARSNGGRVSGNLQAAFNASLYGRDSDLSRGFLTLRGDGKVTAWENLAFVDLRASVSQEALSSLGVQSGDNLTGRGNQTSVRNIVVSPYLIGRFASTGKAEVRYSLADTDTSSTVMQKMQTHTLSANLTDPNAFGKAGWSLAFSDSIIQYSDRRDLNNSSLRGSALFQFNPQVQMRLIAGSESNNFRTVDDKRSTITGVGLDWVASPQTKFSGLWEDRFFGPGYLMSASHQSGRYVISARYSKDASNTSQSLNSVAQFDTYGLLMSMTAARFPDFAERDAFVRAYIADRGLPARLGTSQAVLSSGVFLDRRINLDMMVTSPRNTLQFTVYRSERSALTTQDFSLGPDFSSNTRIKDTSGTVSLTHQMTPITSATVGLTLMRSQQEGSTTGVDLSNRTRRVTAGVMTQFSPKTNGSLMIRNSEGKGTTSYTENAVIGSVSIRF